MTVWRWGPLAAGAVAIALLGASFRTHGWPATIMVLIPTAFVLVLAARRPTATIENSAQLSRGVLLWSLLVGAVLLWEAYAFVRQPDWSRANQDYPTMSTLLDPVLEQGPFRIVGWLVWLGVGWRLATK
jgi:hypothetical protein